MHFARSVLPLGVIAGMLLTIPAAYSLQRPAEKTQKTAPRQTKKPAARPKPAPQPENAAAEARLARKAERMKQRAREMDRRMKARKR